MNNPLKNTLSKNFQSANIPSTQQPQTITPYNPQFPTHSPTQSTKYPKISIIRSKN